MTLKEQIRTDLTAAMKARDEVRSSTLRMVLTAITNAEVSGKQARELSDEEIVTVLSSESKKRREALPGVRTCVACQSERDKAIVHSTINRRGSKDSQLR